MPSKTRGKRKATDAAAKKQAKARRMSTADDESKDTEDTEEVPEFASIMKYAFIENMPTTECPISFPLAYYIARWQCQLRTDDSILGMLPRAHAVARVC
jgi:hypothetical protein